MILIVWAATVLYAGYSFGKAQIFAEAAGKPYANCQEGDIFTYGSYPQGRNGEVKPIEWQVLEREDDRMLVIAQYGLDAQAYNKEWADTNWSRCTLRSWLNGEFMEKAFKPEERENLLEVTLKNPDSYDFVRTYSVPGGPDTCDKVFLLSEDEVRNNFCVDDERYCQPTDYALERGAFECEGNCRWWLRSPGGLTTSAAVVGDDGRCDSHIVDCVHGTVRPAVFLSL